MASIAELLEQAEEKWKEAHRECLEVDQKFAHELAQVQFAMGAVRLSWVKKTRPAPAVIAPHAWGLKY